ncbi:putative replication factor A protein 3 [Trypanosoma cruzi]|nr:putative replication factor A protein 3 [Trypanosoma cruzi]
MGMRKFFILRRTEVAPIGMLSRVGRLGSLFFFFFFGVFHDKGGSTRKNSESSDEIAMRSTPYLGGGARATTNNLPSFTGVSPRVSSRSVATHRGEYVSIVLKPTALNAQRGSLEALCVATDEPVEVMGLPSGAEVAQVNEFVCYVNPSSGELEYFQHGTYNDEYDVETYRKLLDLCPKFPQLF